ncbi:NERD domain-containing protein [Lyngbya sp. CCY1209]|uniref:NERD domain-containing protein n=1 Tax=Lyngbya sp. CCY1209 TaxID=2886103 RepID=UPI002D204765|nr:NERD domain-containing protein [Lyngbya sp. CCY1209]MEB3886249.1 AAA family ATPase [Lyngbya sp. CCY1209]
MAHCFPPLQEINKFRVPLEPGERHLLDFLIKNLDDHYEIYVQPFLNGDKPDIVILKPDAGVLIIEVKDWHLRHYKNPKGGRYPWILIKNNCKIRSPLEQVHTYKDNLYKLHIDKLFEAKIKNSNFFSVVQTAVYFHNESTKYSQSFCRESGYTQILGYDALNPRFFNHVLQKARLNRPSLLFNKELYESFKIFLQPPEHTPDLRQEIQYTKRQKELIISRPNTRQKVRGVAGCGKTKVMAARAVAAYRRTRKTVLILTFNITLRNYIRDRISEVRASFPWSGFEITNYHQFFKIQCNNYEMVWEDEDFFEASDREKFFEPVKDKIERYSTILIDEVQDYKQEWLRLIVNYFLSEDGEFVVFGDEKQNIYGRQMDDDRFPRIPTVRGQWNQLKDSFRMETDLLRVAQEFQKFYFTGRYQLDNDVQPNLCGTSSTLKYYDHQKIGDEEIVDIIRDEMLALSIHPNNLVVLAPTNEKIRSLEFLYRQISHEKTTHTSETKEEYENFSQFKSKLEEIRRGRKLHFWANSGTVKFSTIHSFKGWEAHTLILIISDTRSDEYEGSLNELIYTALTRARNNLIVIDTTSLYREFFAKFTKK